MEMQCIYTGVELDSKTQKEHVLQSFTGATWVSSEVSCNEVQNRFGHGCDVALEKSFRFVRNLIGATGNRKTNMRGSEATSERGYEFLLKNGEYRLNKPFVGPLDNDRITVFVGDEKDFGWAKSCAKKKAPPGYKIAEESGSIGAKIDMADVGWMHHEIRFPSVGAAKGILKSCFNLLGVKKHDVAMWPCFDPLRKCLVQEEVEDGMTIASFCRIVSDDHRIELPRLKTFSHVLLAYSTGSSVYGFARLYGHFDFAMRLSDSYVGEAFQYGYCVDPFGEHGEFERHYEYDIAQLPVFDKQDAKITPKVFDAFKHFYERFLLAMQKRDAQEIVDRVFERHAEEKFLNTVEIAKEISEEFERFMQQGRMK